jgi:CheY-like chemotaxis protein
MMAGPRVLIVEGDVVLAQKAATYFRDAGCSPFIAGDAMKAVTAARDLRPDVIVLNCNLPGGGMNALTRFKSSIRTATIPVVTICGMPEVYQNAGAQICTPDMADLNAVKDAVMGCVSKPATVEQAPRATLEDPARLHALNESGMLDSPPEPMLDAITRLAGQLLNAPTSLISLVGIDRQFFKSQLGLKPPWSVERQTKLSHSFCQWVVAGNEALVIDDARTHPVLSSNLAVRDLGVISYIGTPMQTVGQPIGSLCVIDSVPRQWSEGDLQILSRLALVVETFSPPMLPKTPHSLGITAKALDAIQWFFDSAQIRLDPAGSELMWHITERLGRQLTKLT